MLRVDRAEAALLAISEVAEAEGEVALGRGEMRAEIAEGTETWTLGIDILMNAVENVSVIGIVIETATVTATEIEIGSATETGRATSEHAGLQFLEGGHHRETFGKERETAHQV
jgi:hypothetical protein